MILLYKNNIMFLLSFDVGIKNLAYCLLSIQDNVDNNSKHFIEIVKWNIIDLSCDHVEEAKVEETAVKVLKQCCKCKKTATA